MSKEQKTVLLHGFQSVTSLSLSGDFVSSNQSFELITSFPQLVQLHLSSTLYVVIRIDHSRGYTKQICLDHLSITGSTAWSLLAPHMDSEIRTSKLTLMNWPFPLGFPIQNTVANLYNMIGSSLEQLTLEIPNSHLGEGVLEIFVCAKSRLMTAQPGNFLSELLDFTKNTRLRSVDVVTPGYRFLPTSIHDTSFWTPFSGYVERIQSNSLEHLIWQVPGEVHLPNVCGHRVLLRKSITTSRLPALRKFTFICDYPDKCGYIFR
jgi:hypothetical protein